MISAEEVVAIYKERAKERGAELGRMEQVCHQYQDDVIVPLPELDEQEKPATVNILQQGVDQLATRVASVIPDVVLPSLNPGNDGAESKARDRRSAVLGWWGMNGMERLLRRRARVLIAYGYAPVTLSPIGDSPLDKREIPHWRNRSPLTTFWSPLRGEDIEPLDVICSSEVTLGWLRAKYPLQAEAIYKGDKPKLTDRFTVLEYMDSDEITLVLAGKDRDRRYSFVTDSSGTSSAQVLEWQKNLAGIPLIVAPSRICLGRVMGHFDGTIGMHMRRARLQAYEDIAISRSIWQEQWVVSHPQAPGAAEIIIQADPKTGVIGEIKNGVIQTIGIQPGQQVPVALDRMERNERVQGLVPAELGGESASNIRTARRGNSILSSAIDPTVQELQQIIGASMEAENARAIAIAKAWYGDKQFSFYIPRNGESTKKDYSPNRIFDTDWNVVKYSMPGVAGPDIATELGMRVGTGEISLQTAREVDPLVEDPIMERDRVIEEGLTKGLIAGLEQQLAQGQADPIMVARISTELMQSHESFATVLVNVHKQMQAEQAEQQAAQPQPGAPPGAEQQPGMAAGMAGPPGQGQPTIPQQAPGPQNLAAILGSLHGAQAASPPQGQLQAAS